MRKFTPVFTFQVHHELRQRAGAMVLVWLLILFPLPREHPDEDQGVHHPHVVMVSVLGDLCFLRPTHVLAPELTDGLAGRYETILEGMGPQLAILNLELRIAALPGNDVLLLKIHP